MTTSFIQETIPIRMREMGFGRNYHVQMRTINIPANATFVFPAFNTWLYCPYELLNTAIGITVESAYGILDTTGQGYNEQQFEHSGQVTITNTQPSTLTLTIILAVAQVTKTKSDPQTKPEHGKAI
ncbi:MAG: hypothetical protein AAF998_18460 [Bacteroidota bacterium]